MQHCCVTSCTLSRYWSYHLPTGDKFSLLQRVERASTATLCNKILLLHELVTRATFTLQLASTQQCCMTSCTILLLVLPHNYNWILNYYAQTKQVLFEITRYNKEERKKIFQNTLKVIHYPRQEWCLPQQLTNEKKFHGPLLAWVWSYSMINIWLVIQYPTSKICFRYHKSFSMMLHAKWNLLFSPVTNHWEFSMEPHIEIFDFDKHSMYLGSGLNNCEFVTK